MKKICLLCLVLLPLVAFAQDAYKPFLKEGKRWNYELEHVNVWEDMHTTENVSFIIEGDMEIGGKTYKKMYYATSDETFATLEDKTFYRALREEGRQVYMYDETLGDVLLFDFGMQPGESYVIGESSCLELTSSRQMTFHGRELTVMLYQLKEGAGSESIVESVGCRNGWDILEEFTPVATDGIYDTKRFLSCYEDGGCIFTASDFQQITTDIIQPRYSVEDKNQYDLLGRPVTPHDKGTIYIQNGKKYVRKNL